MISSTSFPRPRLLAGLFLALLLGGAGAVAKPLPQADPDTPSDDALANNSTNLPPVLPYDLRAYLAEPENKDWLNGDTWQIMPRGLTNLGGVDFRFDGLIQVSGEQARRDNREFRERLSFHVGGIEIGSVHFIGGTAWSDDPGAVLAMAVWRYEDGTYSREPIRYAHHVRDVWRMKYEFPAKVLNEHAKVVWRGEHPEARRWGKSLRLYRFTLGNPEPEKPVEWVEIYAGETKPSLILTAMSLDPLGLGERPDDSEDLEEEDPEPKGRIAVTVMEESRDQVIAKARVKAIGRYTTAEGVGDYERVFVTGTNGVAQVRYPEEEAFTSFRLVASAPGFAEVASQMPPGETNFPQTALIRLPADMKLGGVVVDSKGEPVTNAVVTVSRFYDGSERMERPEGWRGMPKEYGDAKTGKEGKWSLEGLGNIKPATFMLAARHPEFSEYRKMGLKESEMEALQSSSFEIQLSEGLVLEGTVTDTEEEPVADAVVRVGLPGYVGTMEGKTDPEGKFKIRGIGGDAGMLPGGVNPTPPEEVSKSVVVQADGYRPETRTIQIRAEMEPVHFVLHPGKSLRGIVQDEEGEFIPGVHVSYNSHSYRGNEGGVPVSWSTSTDARGRFEWRSAPETGILRFYFSKAGWSQLRDVTLSIQEEEHIVVLRPVRKVFGRVVESGTGLPVPSFRVLAAEGTADSLHSYSSSDERTFASETGEFELKLDAENLNVIQVSADTHVTKIHVLPESEEREIEVTIELNQAAVYWGWVVDAEDEPVTGARVFLQGSGSQRVHVNAGRVHAWAGVPSTATDQEGYFILGGMENPENLLVHHESGQTQVPVAAGGQEEMLIVLEGWGRVEGFATINGRPAENIRFSLNSTNNAHHSVVSDAEGYFEIEKVASGTYNLARMIPFDHRSFQFDPRGQSVEVVAGHTTDVVWSIEGATLTGRVDWTPDSDQEAVKLFGTFSSRGPSTAHLSTPEDWAAWRATDEFKEWQASRRTYPVQVDSDGRLTIEAVEPGTYTLSVTAEAPFGDWQSKPLAQGSREVQVTGSGTQDLGSLTLTPVEPPPPDAP